jgi:exonuclease SbcC
MGRFAQEEKSLIDTVAQYEPSRDEVKFVANKAMVYSKLAKAFSKDGVQAIIIDNVIEDLTRIVNQWLAEFCNEPTYINFITQKKNTKGDWRETLEIELVTPSGASRFESLSGGEKFRVGFSIRLAMSVLQARRMGGEVQILLLDEVSTSLDAAGLETFVGLIRKLERDMKVLLITHDDKLKEEFDTIITVRRTADGSKIER